MATLHVRNVPDDLYELLRDCAAANGRSIGAETCQLLYERLVAGTARPRPFPGLRRRPVGRPGIFTRFTAEARAAVVAAQEEARALGHDHVGPQHLLLGILVQTPSLVALRPEHVRTLLDRGEAEPTGRIPFTPEAKRALELALRSALAQGDPVIEPRHLLAGIKETGGPAGEILETVQLPPLQMAPDPSFRVVLLEGEPEDWERQLNDTAALGYELVEVVDRRAIFRR
jgi:Antitoxin FitA-like, ribbon-helix-helix/Clp amino terminal domain, pathogenicity island component